MNLKYLNVAIILDHKQVIGGNFNQSINSIYFLLKSNLKNIKFTVINTEKENIKYLNKNNINYINYFPSKFSIFILKLRSILPIYLYKLFYFFVSIIILKKIFILIKLISFILFHKVILQDISKTLIIFLLSLIYVIVIN